MAILRVSLGFADATDHEVEETAMHVIAGFYANPLIYPPPYPVAPVDFQTALDNFQQAIGKQAQGGTQATAAKDEARAVLLGLLRLVAARVQETLLKNPSYGLAELLLSGFDAVSTNRAQHPLDTPRINEIVNSGTTRLTLRVTSVRNARLYEVQYRTATGEWVSAGLFRSTRGMIVPGLTPGTMYTFQVRAVGGSTGYSDWSDAVSHMSL